MRRVAIALLLVPGFAMAALFGSLFAGEPPAGIGAPGNVVAACPATPNCVSSMAADSEHAIPPLAFSGTPAAALVRLERIVRAEAGASVAIRRDDYLYATFATPLMGFVDDVEFVFAADRHVIDVRSASRIGRSDLGANRRRIEKLRAAFEAAR